MALMDRPGCLKTITGRHVDDRVLGTVQCVRCGSPRPADFDATKLARTSDPETSHEAAQDVAKGARRSATKRALLAALREEDGRTAGELADATGIEYPEVWRRASELKTDGLVEVRGKRTWEGSAKAQGILWLTGVARAQFEVANA
jgi:DNA-binding transcriptional ArsR family regulator